MMLYSGARRRRRPTPAVLLLMSACIYSLNCSVVAFAFGRGTFPRGIPLCCGPPPGQLSPSSGGGVREARRKSNMRRQLEMISKPSQVLVAGASGQLGQRIVRQLLLEGVKVIATVSPSDMESATLLFQDETSVPPVPPELGRRLEIVPVESGDVSSWCTGMQSSDSVVFASGAPEAGEAFSGGVPSEVDGKLAQKVVQAAKETGSVKHFVLVTAQDTTGKFGIPGGMMKLFSGGREEERKAEQALADSGLPYTIVRPGAMEGQQDDLEETHNVRVLPKGAPPGGFISRLQVAKVAAAAIVAPSASTNKVLDIVAEDLAPKVSYSDVVSDARIEGSEELWKNSLNPAQYYVLRMAGTEPAYSSTVNYEKRKGQFTCAGCGQILFSSETKFNSGTGWPSFYQPVEERSVRIVREGGLFPRREVRCSNCDGHLGHVFPDGPKPTGLRYCMNGVALNFKLDESDVNP